MSSLQGRFLSPDPGNASSSVSDPQSWNMYAYARNNPLLFTDPDGEDYQVCDNSGNCGNLSDDQFNQFLQSNPNITYSAGGGLTYFNEDGTYNDLGTANYYDPTAGNAVAFLNFAIGNLAIDYATGLAGPLLGTVGNIIADTRMARVGLGLQGAAESANAAKAAVRTVAGTKQLVKAGLNSLGLKPEQAANVLRAVDRAGNNATISVESLADGSVQVTTSVPGRAGGLANYSKVISPSGMTVPGSVVQSAYDAAGNLVHYDPKF